MNGFFNLSTNLILIKDVSNIINFDFLREEFDKFEFERNIYNYISTDKHIFSRDDFKEIKLTLENECKDYLRYAYGAVDFENIEIVNSWGNKTLPEGSHQDHAHPFSIVSGVLYLDNNPDNLNFAMNTHTQDIPCYLYRKQGYKTLKDFVGEGNNLQNHLLLILSNVGHRVLPSQTDLTRRTIAFNTFWKGNVGTNGDILNSKIF